MKIFQRLGITGILVGALVACSPGGSKPDPNLFTEANAWKEGIPADAQMVNTEEFQKGIASGELVLSSSASVAAAKQARETQYQSDKNFLSGISDKDPNTAALLAEAAGSPSFEGDRPVSGPGGESVVLFGLGTQLRNAAETYQRSQSVDNALDDYALSYSLLPEDLKPQAPSPDSLKGKSLAEVKAALEQLNSLLGSKPASLRTARLEPGGGIRPQAINPGNGTDNNGPCTPSNLVKRFWFPLKNFISPVKNQAKRGTCWAFAAIGAVESRERVQNNNPVDLSEQFLVNKVKQDWDSSDYSDGYWSEKALETAVNKGQSFPSEGGWTYNGATSRPSVKDGDSDSYANSCNGYTGTCSDTAHQSRRVCTTFIFTFCSYAKVTFGGPGVASSKTIQVWKNGDTFKLNLLRQYLSQGYVLLASFPVYKGFMDDVKSDGVVSNYAKTKLDDKGKEVAGSYGGHAVQIVGFLSNEDMSQFGQTPNIGGGGYFIVKNSWGCGAGDGGFYYVPADYVSSIFNSLSVLNFDGRRSEAWKQEQAAPGGSEAPKISIKTNPATVQLRVETNLAQFFQITHPVAKSVNLSVTSNLDGTLYSGGWSTDPNSLFGPELKRTFTSVGSRTLTLLAKYGNSQASSSFVVKVINTPPTLNLQYGGDPHQGEAYSITALITDPNEPDINKLCGTTTWSVDAPDTLSAGTGCSVSVTFGATGSRQVRVTTQDSDGATATQTLNLNVLPTTPKTKPKLNH
ncbi:C1 family peptidase [Allomeiothermus silvanus]|uniref:C1 family peptidase n=1 Tax=Allomeiothermus silvanus TaxID=52022 RepID=UPI0023F142C8|nr:C1 family peptidase [Allomeiothermus silvanus]